MIDFFFIYRLLDFRHRLRLSMLLVLSILASLLELIAIALMLPFISLLTQANDQTAKLPNFLNNISIIDFSDLRVVAIYLIATNVLSASVKLLLLYSINIVSHRIGNFLASKLVLKISRSKYSELAKIKQTELITSVWQRTNEVVYQTVLPGVSIVSAIVIVVVNISFFFYLEPAVTGQILGSLGFVYIATFMLTRKKVLIHGKRISELNEVLLEKLSFLFGRYRDLFVNKSFEAFIKEYSQHDLNVRMSRAKVQIVGGFPKIIIEAFFIVLIGIAALYSTKSDSLTAYYLPFLVTFLFGMQKLLPQIQQIYQSKVALQSGSHALMEIRNFLKIPDRHVQMQDVTTSHPNTIFEFHDVNYQHLLDGPVQINGLSFTINRGEKICISGPSGSGKSTLIDLIIGLNIPTSGTIFRKQLNSSGQLITILSQHFHIDHGSIRDLITSNGAKKLSDDEIFEILDIVCLTETIQKLPGKLDCILLNDASNLSGGQRQRLGLAIALVEKFDILIMDEATSQLDRTLEFAVYRNILNHFSLRTIIFITHTEQLKELADRTIDLD